MKILILSTSPRKSFSTSLYYSKLLGGFLAGHEVRILSLKSTVDYNSAVAQLKDIDTLVFASPVYVDTLPSTMLAYLKKFETYIRENRCDFKVYAILNCGFYEGHQCSLALNTYALWCERAGLTWCGGIGIGSGVMLGFIRVLPLLGLALSAIELFIRSIVLLGGTGLSLGALFSGYVPINLIIQTSIWILFSLGAFIHIYALRTAIVQGKKKTVRFTTAWCCPRFLFVAMASFYWMMRALFLHGVMPWKLFAKDNDTV